MRFHNSPPVAKSKKLSTKLFGLCSDESIISHRMILNRYSLFCVYSVMGLIGPNGSGKTTTIKLILNMLKKNQGKIEILGYDNIKEEQIAKENLGIVFDSNYFVDEWNMKMVEKAMSRFYKTWNHLRFYSYIEQFKIAKSKKVKELSKGMQMKLMLACAFSYDSKLLILDEP